jgi:sugar O-acyltransferase (sialic acid O-acetyltransferase NeuD family)
MRQVVIIGAGGFGREVAWICRRANLQVVGFCDDAESLQNGEFDGAPLLGSIEQAAKVLDGKIGFHCAIGDNRTRQALAGRALSIGWQPVTVIDPTAVIAENAQIGAGSFIGAMAFVAPETVIGRMVLINYHAGVGHGCSVGDFAQLCPGARVSGNCRLAEGAMIGSNGVLLPNRSVGAWATLGASALGVRDVADGETVARVR